MYKKLTGLELAFLFGGAAAFRHGHQAQEDHEHHTQPTHQHLLLGEGDVEVLEAIFMSIDFRLRDCILGWIHISLLECNTSILISGFFLAKQVLAIEALRIRATLPVVGAISVNLTRDTTIAIIAGIWMLARGDEGPVMLIVDQSDRICDTRVGAARHRKRFLANDDIQVMQYSCRLNGPPPP